MSVRWARGGETRKRLGSTASGLALLIGVAAAPALAQQPAQSPAAAEHRLALNIPAQDLNGAILAFADKAGIPLFYDVSLVRGPRSQGVAGELTPQEALPRILAGTGLTFRFTGPRRVRISKDSLAALLDRASGDDRGQRVFLRADKSVDYDTLTQVMNDLRAAGYLKIALVGLDKSENP